MKAAGKQQSSSRASSPKAYNSVAGRKRYFVNIVTADQVSKLQNDAVEKSHSAVPAPGKYQSRILILAPNTETIEKFQNRALTQFQYNTNVSAQSVKLLESHFCEVPKSYSVGDALDAKSEAYLVVENIAPLGPGQKRKAPEDDSVASAPATPNTEPSAKRLRRRGKQAIKLASPAPEDSQPGPEASTPSAKPAANSASQETVHQPQKPTAGSPSPNLPSPSHPAVPLFGRTRANNERKASMSASSRPSLSQDKSNPLNVNDTPRPGLSSSRDVSNAAASAQENTDAGATAGAAAPQVPETPKRKRGRPPKANPVTPSAQGDTDSTALNGRDGEQSSNGSFKNASAGGSDSVVVESHRELAKAPAKSASNSSISTEEQPKRGETKKARAGSDVVGGSNESAIAARAKDAAPPSQKVEVEDDNDRDGDSSTASGTDESDSSGSDSDSGERQRRLSRRRVVVPSAIASQPSKPQHSAKSEAKPSKAQGHSMEGVEQKKDSRSKPEPATAGTAETKKNGTTAESKPLRVPGLGSLADLSNMRLPTVHEGPSASPQAAKKTAVEESSEEEEDNNESDDSNDSDSSSSSSGDSSDDESTAGRKSRKRGGLLGLLGNK